MKKFILLFLLAALTIASSCKRDEQKQLTGNPDPPFQGDVPQEAYKFEGEPGTYGGQLVMAQPNEPKRFNVITAGEVSSVAVLYYHLFRCLIDYKNGGDPPDYDAGLCTKWEATPDAKQWTFYIRKGVRWSDGQPFTADDVLFTYEVMKDERVNNSLRDIFNEGKDADNKQLYPDLQKIDDHTVRFTLHQSNGAFLDSILNLYLIPKHKWEQSWRDGKFNEAMGVTEDPGNVVGLGPFRLKEFTSGQRVVLERNPYFWKVDKNGQRLPYLDRIIFVIAKDFNTITAKFDADEIDLMDRIRAEEFSLVKRKEGANVKVEDIGVSQDSYWMTLNQNAGVNPKTGKPFVEVWKQKLYRNQKFRQAVSYAIDREGLANTVFAGRAVPLYSFVTPGDKVWYSDNIMKYPYNKELARQMLADIGLKDSNGDGFVEDPEGHTVEIVINPNVGNSQRESSAAFIAKNLQEVGIKASSNALDANLIVEMLQSTYSFDAILFGWQSGVPPGPPNVKNLLLSSGDSHTLYPKQKSPSTEWEARVDQLVKQIDETLDMAERKKMFAEIQRIWSEQVAEIYLVSERAGIAYKSKFGNIAPSTLAPRVTWNSEEIYIKK
jgi:peptide/nickel transport system substrate-binding protein